MTPSPRYKTIDDMIQALKKAGYAQNNWIQGAFGYQYFVENPVNPKFEKPVEVNGRPAKVSVTIYKGFPESSLQFDFPQGKAAVVYEETDDGMKLKEIISTSNKRNSFNS